MIILFDINNILNYIFDFLYYYYCYYCYSYNIIYHNKSSGYAKFLPTLFSLSVSR